MNKKLRLIITFSITALLTACSDDSGYYNESNPTDNSEIILKERDKSLPEVVTKAVVLGNKPTTRVDVGNNGIIGNSDVLLGYSYSLGNSIMGDYDNVISPIVDIEKVKAIDYAYITSKFINTNYTRSFTYSDFDRYESKSSVTKKVINGFNLKVGIFSLGRKKTTTDVFKSSTITNSESVFGELEIELRNSSFLLQSADGSRKFYARECLSNTFMKNLYSSTVGDILKSYGDFVMTGYTTGGKAFAFYTGIDKNGDTMESKEKNMNTDINMSFSWSSNSASGNLNFGKDNSNMTSTGYKTKEAEIQVRTYGGKSSGQAIAGAVSLEKMELDLSPWLSSLDNSNTHTIIDILDQGLYPLSYFVLEENFKKRFDDSFRGVLESREKLITPSIEIVKVFIRTSSSGIPLYEVAAVLNTRQGDKIVLSDGKASTASDAELMANANNTTYTQKVNTIFAQKKKYFSISFKSSAGTKLNPAIRNPLCINLSGFNETTMYRYTNPKTGMEYIYDTSKRIALSHLTSQIDGDWILDAYGIREWVESLPIKSISMATIANTYRIIGL